MTTKLSTADTTLNVFLSRPLKVEVHVWPSLKSALGGVANPALNALMSTVTPKNAQGELQGASASLNSFAMILGPLLMNGALFYFTRPETSVHFAGAAFLLASILTTVSIIPFLRGVSANKADLPVEE